MIACIIAALLAVTVPAGLANKQPCQGLGVAVLGVAHIHTQDAVRALQASNGICVEAVWDSDTARARAVGATLGAPVVSLPELALARPNVRAVLILSETVHHPALVRATVAAGKHVFVEKPLALTAADANDLASLIDAAGLTFHTGFFLRDVPAVRKLEHLLARGQLGQVARVRLVFAHAGALDGWFAQYAWMLDPAQAGYGGFGDLGIHAVDLLHHLFGSPARVQAFVEPHAPATVERFGEALLQLNDGAVASIAAGWAERGDMLQIDVRGALGTAYLAHNRWHVQLAGAVATDELLPGPDATTAVSAFLTALLSGDKTSLVPARDAAQAVATMERLYKSHNGVW